MHCSRRTARTRRLTLTVIAGSVLLAFPLVKAAPEEEPEARLGQMAPRFFLPQLDGGDFFLRDYAGPDNEIRSHRRGRPKEVVVLSFFAAWCVPCRRELPELQAMSRAYPGQPVQWRLVNVGDRPDSARSFVGRLGVQLPVLLDRYKKVSERYCTGLPALVVVDREGIVRYLHLGYDEGDENAMKRVAGTVSQALGVPVPAAWRMGEAAGDSTEGARLREKTEPRASGTEH